MRDKYIQVDWPGPGKVQAWQTTRFGGFSQNGYSEFNLAATVGDDPVSVDRNRKKLISDLDLPGEPEWIRLVHGNRVLNVLDKMGLEEADATYTDTPNRVLIIPTADCLPVLFTSKSGRQIAAAHAGWRGLSAGILENTLAQFYGQPEKVQVWFGPAIGPDKFEVGEEVFDAFHRAYPGCETAFKKGKRAKKLMADIYALGRFALWRAGVRDFYGGGFCTMSDERFFSYRRQGRLSGRMATLIWIADN